MTSEEAVSYKSIYKCERKKVFFSKTGSEQELENLVKHLDRSSTAYGMEINANKTKLMNSSNGIQRDITANGEKLKTVKKFKYLGAIFLDEGFKPKVLARIAMTAATLTKLDIVWKDKAIKLSSMIRLMRSLVNSVFLYACETLDPNSRVREKGPGFEMRCFRRLIGISYKNHITNEEVRNRIKQASGLCEDLLSTIKRRKLIWFGHMIRGGGGTCKDSFTGNSEKRKERKTKEEVGRQHRRMDWTEA